MTSGKIDMIKTEDVYIITVSLALHFKNHSNLHNMLQA